VTTFVVVLAALAAAGFGVGTYLLREPPVRGRGLLAGLRAATLVFLVLLLWNPRLPLGEGEEAPGGVEPLVLLDASLSMEARSAEGATWWEEGLERARSATEGGGRILLFGSRVRPVGPAALDSVAPADRESRLGGALERSAELGARTVRVVSDLRLEDPREVARDAARTGLTIRFDRVGEGVRNAGVGEVVVPPTASEGDTLDLELLLHGEGGEAGDSVELSVEIEGGSRVVRSALLPEPGRPVRHRVSLSVPEGSGTRRVRVEVDLAGDAFPRDDARSAFVEVTEVRGGLVLLSFVPDWEPRHLLPVLEQVTGLEAQGFLRLAGDRWLPMGRLDDRTSPLPEAEVVPRAERARILVIHGLDGASSGWVDDLRAGAEGRLVFPGDRVGTQRVGVPTAGPVQGEWYSVPDVPPSPLAGELSGVLSDDLPPLTGTFPLAGSAGGPVVLHLRRAGGGPAEAGMVLREEEGRREVVVLASGFWRWASREGSPRDAYRRLWAGVSGWLLEAGEEGRGPEMAPRPPVQGEGVPVRWSVGRDAPDSVRIEVRHEADGGVVADTVVATEGASEVRTRPLDPGLYAFRIGDGGDGGEGRFEISPYTEELLRRPLDPDRVAGSGEGEGIARAGPGRGTPLRTRTLPYLLLLGLLCAEWIGRRRAGLR